MALSVVMTCLILAACGGNSANKALQDWTDDHGQKVAQGNSAYEAATAAAGPNNDAAGMIAAADTFLPILNAALSALNRLDYNGLSSDNKTTFNGEKQGLESLISNVTENRGIWESFAQQQGGGEQYDDGGEDYGYDDYGDDDYGDDDYGDDDYGDDDD